MSRADEASNKIVPLEQLARRLSDVRHNGAKVGLCHGVFDVMHPGHIIHLNQAKTQSDVLVVTLTSDQYVNRGPGRPVFDQQLRMETIASLESVDFVSLSDSPTSLDVIRKIRPDIYFKGEEYRNNAEDVTGNIEREKAAVREIGGEMRFTNGAVFSSSHLANRFFSSFPPETEEYLADFRRRHSSDEVLGVLDSLVDTRVLVVGEAIIDEYVYCVPLAKSPREFIIATKQLGTERHAGGSVAVANHLAGLCNEVTLAALFGETDDGESFCRAALRPNVRLAPITSPDRTTVTKRRFLDPDFYTKMFEVQNLNDDELPEDVEARLSGLLSAECEVNDMVMVNDFGHGMLGPRVRHQLEHCGRFLAVNAQTNSANYGFNPVTKYSRADYVSIDEPELWLSAGVRQGNIPLLVSGLQGDLGSQGFMVTRGRRGSVFVSPGGRISETPAFASRAVDRVGAGDAFYSITAPCMSKGADPEVVGFIGNCVGALAVEIVGNREPIDAVSLRKFIVRLLK